MGVKSSFDSRSRWRWLRGIAIVSLATASVAPRAALSADPPSAAEITARQVLIEQRVVRLEGRMAQLINRLAEREPAQAARLQAALRRAGEAQLRERLAASVSLLRDERLDDAELEQRVLVEELSAVLTLLTEETAALDQLRDERQRLEALLERSTELLAQQREHNEASRQQEGRMAQAEALAALADQLEALARQQQSLRQPTSATPDDQGSTASGDTGQDEARIAATEPSTQPSAADAAAQDALAERAESAVDELRQQANEAPPSGQSTLENASSMAQQASASMRAAGAALRSTEPANASRMQQQAEAALQAAAEQIRAEQERLERMTDLQQRAEAQQQTQRETAETAEAMQPNGAQPGAPGAREMSQAAAAMQAAGEQMQAGADGQAAAEQQQTAAENLEQAQQQLADALEQVRREEREQLLEELRGRLLALLARQRRIQTTVEPLAERERLGPADQVQLDQAAAEQFETAISADEVLRLLVRDETTLVLPELMQHIRGDMELAGERLEAADLSSDTLFLLGDLVAQLEGMVEAIEAQQQADARGEAPPPGQPGGESASASAPLLPGSAELRLLKSAQQRVLARTRQLSTLPAPDSDFDARMRHELLGARQQRLAEVAAQMIERSQR